ncbi:KAP family P-loop NTPase fold protein [Shewanella sp. 125m-7]
MNISNHASKFIDWEQQYNWGTCKTNREEYGKFIAHFLTTDSRVINLNGIYGSGKTEFIRRLYIELAKQGYPVVYIDAWESDFSNNPLAVLCSELLQQIEYVFKERAPNGKAKEKELAKKTLNTLKGKLGTCLRYLEVSTLITGEPTTIATAKTARTFVDAIPDLSVQTKSKEYVEIIQKNHIEAVQAIKDIKGYITYLSDLIEVIYELNIPIVILIDELDRCRPTYAIEVLEVIKHFFETKGCTFLVATNTEVLEHSVQSIYGTTFDAKLYLRRFFDRKICLPQVSILDYLSVRKLNLDKYKNNNIYLHPFTSNQQANIKLFADLFENANLELRDVEQILNRFFASLDYAAGLLTVSHVLINTVVLMVGLIEQHLDILPPNRTNKSASSNLISVINYDTKSNSLSGMVEAMFRCVTVTSSHEMYTANNARTTFATPREMLALQAAGFDDIAYLKTNNLLWELSGHYDDKDCNVWLWEDYQKIIELSGHIQ